MFEQDYIMRQIKEITAVMAKVLFNAKVEDSNTAMLESAKDSEVIDSWYYTHGNEFPLQYFVEDMNAGAVKS